MVNAIKARGWPRGLGGALCALLLTAACTAPPPSRPEPPPEPQELPRPPVPPSADGTGLLGGPPPPPAPEESANGLTTFRRADGVMVTVMRPIPNPGEEQAAPEPRPSHPAAAPAHRRHHAMGRHRRHRGHHPHAPAAHPAAPAHKAPAGPAAAAPGGKAHVLAPTKPLTPPKTVEHPKPSAPPAGASVRVPIAPPQGQIQAPSQPATQPAAGNGEEINVPGFGKASLKSLTGAGLLIAAMALLVLLARRMSDMGTRRRRPPHADENGIVVPKAMPETREFPAESQPTAGEESRSAPDEPGKP